MIMTYEFLILRWYELQRIYDPSDSVTWGGFWQLGCISDGWLCIYETSHAGLAAAERTQRLSADHVDGLIVMIIVLSLLDLSFNVLEGIFGLQTAVNNNKERIQQCLIQKLSIKDVQDTTA